MTEKQIKQINAMRNRGATYSEIAVATCLSESAIKSYCWRHKIQVVEKKSDEHNSSILCPNCKVVIIQKPKQKPRRFCSEKCRTTWWNKNRKIANKSKMLNIACDFCGIEFEKLNSSSQRYCSHNCYIKDRFGEVNQNEE